MDTLIDAFFLLDSQIRPDLSSDETRLDYIDAIDHRFSCWLSHSEKALEILQHNKSPHKINTIIASLKKTPSKQSLWLRLQSELQDYHAMMQSAGGLSTTATMLYPLIVHVGVLVQDLEFKDPDLHHIILDGLSVLAPTHIIKALTGIEALTPRPTEMTRSISPNRGTHLVTEISSDNVKFYAKQSLGEHQSLHFNKHIALAELEKSLFGETVVPLMGMCQIIGKPNYHIQLSKEVVGMTFRDFLACVDLKTLLVNSRTIDNVLLSKRFKRYIRRSIDHNYHQKHNDENITVDKLSTIFNKLHKSTTYSNDLIHEIKKACESMFNQEMADQADVDMFCLMLRKKWIVPESHSKSTLLSLKSHTSDEVNVTQTVTQLLSQKKNQQEPKSTFWDPARLLLGLRACRQLHRIQMSVKVLFQCEDPFSFFDSSMMELNILSCLFRHEVDGKSPNYIVTRDTPNSGLRLSPIDLDDIFESITIKKASIFSDLKAILLTLPIMNQTVSDTMRNRLLRFKPKDFIFNWLDKLNDELSPREEIFIRTCNLSDSEAKTFNSPFRIHEEFLVSLHDRYDILIKCLDDPNKTPTYAELFQAMYPHHAKLYDVCWKKECPHLEKEEYLWCQPSFNEFYTDYDDADFYHQQLRESPEIEEDYDKRLTIKDAMKAMNGRILKLKERLARGWSRSSLSSPRRNTDPEPISFKSDQLSSGSSPSTPNELPSSTSGSASPRKMSSESTHSISPRECRSRQASPVWQLTASSSLSAVTSTEGKALKRSGGLSSSADRFISPASLNQQLGVTSQSSQWFTQRKPMVRKPGQKCVSMPNIGFVSKK